MKQKIVFVMFTTMFLASGLLFLTAPMTIVATWAKLVALNYENQIHLMGIFPPSALEIFSIIYTLTTAWRENGLHLIYGTIVLINVVSAAGLYLWAREKFQFTKQEVTRFFSNS